MTCGHCVASVTEEVSRGRRRRPTSTSTSRPARVTVTSDAPVDDAAVRAAVEEAGYAAGRHERRRPTPRPARGFVARPGRRLRRRRSASARRSARSAGAGGRRARRHGRRRATAHGGGTAARRPTPDGCPAACMVSEDGYTLRPRRRRRSPPARDARCAFTIVGPGRRSRSTAYDVEHEQGPAPDRRPPRPHRLPARAPRRSTPTAPGRSPLDLTPGRLAGVRRLRAGRRRRALIARRRPRRRRATYAPDAAAAPDVRTAEVDGYTVTLDGELVAGERVRR